MSARFKNNAPPPGMMDDENSPEQILDELSQKAGLTGRVSAHFHKAGKASKAVKDISGAIIESQARTARIAVCIAESQTVAAMTASALPVYGALENNIQQSAASVLSTLQLTQGLAIGSYAMSRMEGREHIEQLFQQGYLTPQERTAIFAQLDGEFAANRHVSAQMSESSRESVRSMTQWAQQAIAQGRKKLN